MPVHGSPDVILDDGGPVGYPSPLRPEVVRIVREQVRTGLYQPPVDEVAEQIVAWLFADGWARAELLR